MTKSRKPRVLQRNNGHLFWPEVELGGEYRYRGSISFQDEIVCESRRRGFLVESIDRGAGFRVVGTCEPMREDFRIGFRTHTGEITAFVFQGQQRLVTGVAGATHDEAIEKALREAHRVLEEMSQEAPPSAAPHIDVYADVADAFRMALPDIRRSLEVAEVSIPGTDDELVRLLAGAVAGYANHAPASLRPLRRHAECRDCDALISYHRAGHSHCEVCDEYWPCEDAGKIDEEHVAHIRRWIAEIDAKAEPTTGDKRRRRQYVRRLAEEGIAVSDDPTPA